MESTQTSQNLSKGQPFLFWHNVYLTQSLLPKEAAYSLLPNSYDERTHQFGSCQQQKVKASLPLEVLAARVQAPHPESQWWPQTPYSVSQTEEGS